MLTWHSRQPVNGKTPMEVLHAFFKLILYEELHITMTNKRIFLFRNEEGVSLSFESLTKEELDDVGKIYEKRHELFYDVFRFTNGNWKLSDLRSKKSDELFTERYRRELIRDFVHYTLAKKPQLRIDLIIVAQLLIEDDKKRGDEFLSNLHDKLQGIGNINNLLVIYD